MHDRPATFQLHTFAMSVNHISHSQDTWQIQLAGQVTSHVDTKTHSVTALPQYGGCPYTRVRCTHCMQRRSYLGCVRDVMLLHAKEIPIGLTRTAPAGSLAVHHWVVLVLLGVRARHACQQDSTALHITLPLDAAALPLMQAQPRPEATAPASIWDNSQSPLPGRGKRR